ncbi:hypothetical protein Dimus_015486 [Dionaea muscipula]
MVAKDFTVDLNKPLVFQVGHLGEAYDEWVHQPIVSKVGPRFFANDYAELLTCTKWWVIPIVWVPVASWFISLGVERGLSSDQTIVNDYYWGNTFHYFVHGFHHKHPMDSLRLVFPPALTAIAATPLWSIIYLLTTPTIAPALFGGGLLGYVMYDITHYYLHHGQAVNKSTQKMKKYHLNHHFKEQEMGYGVTSSFWDHIFGTFPQPKVYSKN